MTKINSKLLQTGKNKILTCLRFMCTEPYELQMFHFVRFCCLDFLLRCEVWHLALVQLLHHNPTGFSHFGMPGGYPPLIGTVASTQIILLCIVLPSGEVLAVLSTQKTHLPTKKGDILFSLP